jgi:hypothetical protein
MPGVEAIAYWTGKRGAPISEWEDAFALDESTGRFALADGASNSVHAASWARHLTSAFVTDPFDATDGSALDQWIRRRCLEFDELRTARAASLGSDSDWYVDAAESLDGFATFLGIEFGLDGNGEARCRWVGVGDACLFHIRDGRLLAVVPIDSADRFGRHPALVSSNLGHRAAALDAAFRGESLVAQGDGIWLLSDALAEWALRRAEVDQLIWDRLDGLDSAAFDELVGELQSAEEMTDDDATFVRCRVTP